MHFENFFRYLDYKISTAGLLSLKHCLNQTSFAIHFYSGALAREARAAEHHGYENVVNYPSEKMWQ